MTFERSGQENTPGYKPLELEYRDGHLWMPNGVRFEPDFKVGPDQRQIDLFIEYERTFGRGKAFEITHQTSAESQKPEVLERYGGPTMLSHFEHLSQDVPLITGDIENASYAEKYIKQLQKFRTDYPKLYEDSVKHTESGHPY
jgi:hypothetical protein